MGRTLKPLVLFVLAVIALVLPHQNAEDSCTSVLNTLSPCLNYLLNVSGDNVPPKDCCNGIKSVFNAATTKADRQAVCSCLKSVSGYANPAIISKAAGLPAKCGVSIPYNISPSIDCSRVS